MNKREVTFELATGRIVSGPPALVSKWICTEQLADILANNGRVIDHLYTADDEQGVRLARVDYLTAKRREESGEFAINSHIQYGKHGVFRVLSFDADSGNYTLVSGKREITVPRIRLEAEARVIEQGEPPIAKPAPDFSRYREPSTIDGEGSIEIDDADLARMIESWCEANLPAIIERHLANHPAAGGKDHSVQ